MSGQPAFRFYDNREKYLLFVTTTTEKEAIARRVGRELELLSPKPPALRLFDAGMGDATVLGSVLEEMHWRFPTIPFLVVGKEISMEDTRIGLSRLDARFAEHPETVVVMTNMYYSEAPWLRPQNGADIMWWDMPLEGTTAHEFATQLRGLGDIVKEGWQTESGGPGGALRYVNPSAIVLYREDHAFALQHIIPTEGSIEGNYDLVIAAQPFRSRTNAAFKVNKVLAPMARALAPEGRMVVIQSTGRDPGMEIIRAVWPGEDPFVTPRQAILDELDHVLNADEQRFRFEGTADDDSLFRYEMHALPEDVDGQIGTSMLLAAWNAAIYVAQIEAERSNDVLKSGLYLDATESVLHKHGRLWFQDESFVVTPVREDRA